MYRLLALALVLSACGSGTPAPDAPSPDAPTPAAATPEASGVAGSGQAAPADPQPAAPVVSAEEAGEESEPLVDSDPADQRFQLTVANSTGLTVVAFHLAACGESEGNDWATMREWTYDYLEAPIPPGGEAQIELSNALGDGCFMTLPVWEDGTEIPEKVETRGTSYVQNLTFGG